MSKRLNKASLLFILVLISCKSISIPKTVEPSTYLADIVKELEKEWPKNRTINLVFHGHSVPAGYFKTPIVNTLDSYPYRVLSYLKEKYPYAVINCINTAIGGENSVQGQARFSSQVLTHRPDVLFIDYSLNDLRVGLAEARSAWEKMIQKALKTDVKVILLTPSPNQKLDLLDPTNELAQHRNQVIQLSQAYSVGLIDSYQIFQKKARAGERIADFMSQSNHPNKKGHAMIAKEIQAYFSKQ